MHPLRIAYVYAHCAARGVTSIVLSATINSTLADIATRTLAYLV